jgi:hypothetical protein
MLFYLLLAGAANKQQRSVSLPDSELDLGSLYKLDSNAADTLRPWMVLKNTDKLTGFAGRPGVVTPLRNLLCQCNVQVNSIAGGERAEWEHEEWTSTLINTIFLGKQKPWDTPEFNCLLDGFTTPLSADKDFTITKVVSLSIPCAWI